MHSTMRYFPGDPIFPLILRIQRLVPGIEKTLKFCRHEDRDAVKEKVIYGQERSERKSSHHRAREFERTASSSPACCSDSGVRYRFAPVASRPRRASSPGNDGTTQPLISRHHDAARSLQEIALAGCRTNLLSASPLVRQTLRRTIGDRGHDRRTDTTSRRRLDCYGSRCGRNYAH